MYLLFRPPRNADEKEKWLRRMADVTGSDDQKLMLASWRSSAG